MQLDGCCPIRDITVRPGRRFIRGMLSLLRVATKPYYHIRLNKGFRADLLWWLTFVSPWNGVSMLCKLKYQNPDVDASGSWGCAAVRDRHWFQLQWAETLVFESTLIAGKELLPVLIAARHIPGYKNVEADMLSRNGVTLFSSSHPQADQSPTSLNWSLVQSLVVITPDWMSPSWIKSFSTSCSNLYSTFCSKVDIPPLPVNKNILCGFVASLADDGLCYETIKCYLSAVRHSSHHVWL